ncbi:hypothetical protein HDU76_008744 [Blyttiomyces sp. JEL0837]|nr:hypothetical protein HDU76_008744 [Blyttiomyces sp. JEL0837]
MHSTSAIAAFTVMVSVFASFIPNSSAGNIDITLNATTFPPVPSQAQNAPGPADIAEAMKHANKFREYYETIKANNSAILKAINMTMDDVIKYGTPALSNRDVHDSCNADYYVATSVGPQLVRACKPNCKVGFFTLNYINNDHNQPNQQNCYNCVTPTRISDFLWTGAGGGSIGYGVSQSVTVGWSVGASIGSAGDSHSFWSSFSVQVSGQYSWSETSQTGFTYTANVSPKKTCALTFQPAILRAWGWINYNVAYDSSCNSGTEWDWVWTEVDAPLKNTNGGEHLDGTYGLCEEVNSNGQCNYYSC